MIFPIDFHIFYMEDDNSPNSSPIFLRISFLMTTKTKIDVHAKILIIKFDGEIVEFNISISCNFVMIYIIFCAWILYIILCNKCWIWLVVIN